MNPFSSVDSEGVWKADGLVARVVFGVPNFAPSLYWLMVTGSAWAIVVTLKMSSKILKMRVKLIYILSCGHTD